MARRDKLDHAGFMEHRGPARRTSGECRVRLQGIGLCHPAVDQVAGHRANMLRTDVTKYGLASAVSASGRKYWALELGE